MRPGRASVREVTEPRLCSSPGWLRPLAYALSLCAVWDPLCSWPRGLRGPSTGGMFDRRARVFSKQTLIHVSRRNLQTDSAGCIHQRRDGLCKQRPTACLCLSADTPPCGSPERPVLARPLEPCSVPSPSPEAQPHMPLTASIFAGEKTESQRRQVSCLRSHSRPATTGTILCSPTLLDR